jgi:hypothetical protein
MSPCRQVSLLSADIPQEVLNETERANPTAHGFANQYADYKKRCQADPWKYDVSEIPSAQHQLYRSKGIAYRVCLKSPSPKNWKQGSQNA